MYERFERDRALIPEGHLAELRFEELTGDPVGQMQRVYDELGLGDSSGPAGDRQVRGRAPRSSGEQLLAAARDGRAGPAAMGAVLRALRYAADGAESLSNSRLDTIPA